MRHEKKIRLAALLCALLMLPLFAAAEDVTADYTLDPLPIDFSFGYVAPEEN